MNEVEKRVLLSNDKIQEFLKFLKSKAKFVRKFRRFTIVHVIHPGSIPDLENPLDIRIRTTKDKGKLTVKSGKIHKDKSRSEYELDIKVDQIPTLLSILNLLGFKSFVMTYLERSEFSFNGLTVTVDKYFSIDANMVEVEVIVNSKNKVLDAEKKINKFLEEKNLTALNAPGMTKFIERVNNVTKMQVDFTKTTPDKWFKKWEDYIYCKK